MSEPYTRETYLTSARAEADFPPRAFGFGQEGILAAAAEFAKMSGKYVTAGI
ncbi:MAG: hypothetical protein WBS33_13390 [Verrucomicrobiia bacterium]